MCTNLLDILGKFHSVVGEAESELSYQDACDFLTRRRTLNFLCIARYVRMCMARRSSVVPRYGFSEISTFLDDMITIKLHKFPTSSFVNRP